jgi:hypothetical protein
VSASGEGGAGRRDAPHPNPLSHRVLGTYLLAWVLAAAPLVASGELVRSLGDGSRLALVWVPWIALIGLPLGPESRRAWPLALGLALPQLALALWLDLQLGLGPARLEATFLGGLLCVGFLGEARHRAARAGLTLYGPLWFLLVPVLPAVVVALAWGAGGRLPTEGGLAWLAGLSPLTSTWRDVQPLEGELAREAWDAALFCPSSLACVVLWLVVTSLARREEART